MTKGKIPGKQVYNSLQGGGAAILDLSMKDFIKCKNNNKQLIVRTGVSKVNPHCSPQNYIAKLNSVEKLQDETRPQHSNSRFQRSAEVYLGKVKRQLQKPRKSLNNSKTFPRVSRLGVPPQYFKVFNMPKKIQCL